jgi:hypothetical protein
MERYRLVSDLVVYKGLPSAVGIRCLTCMRVSWNPNDVAQRYCGFCHVFHEDADKAAALARDKE